MDGITITYRTVNSKDQVVIKEKTFKTETAMQRWVAAQEKTGRFLGVYSYSR